jgi:hypothetical protein
MRANLPPEDRPASDDPREDQLTIRGRGGLYNGETYTLAAGQSGTVGRSSLASFPVTTSRNFRRLRNDGGAATLISALDAEHLRLLYVGEGRLILENLSEDRVTVGHLEVTDRIDLDLSEGGVEVRFGYGERLLLSRQGSEAVSLAPSPARVAEAEIERQFSTMLQPVGEAGTAPERDLFAPDLRLAPEAELREHETEPPRDPGPPPPPVPRRKRRRRRVPHPAFFLSFLFHAVIVLGLFSFISARIVLDQGPITADLSLVDAEKEAPPERSRPKAAETFEPARPRPAEQAPASLVEDEHAFSPALDRAAAPGEPGAAGATGADMLGLIGIGGGGLGGPSGAPGGGSPAETGGSGDPDGAIALALDWLARHQLADGSWGGISSVRHYARGRAKREYRVALTGLATLAFVRAGHTHKDGEYHETVRKAARYLSERDQRSGGFHPPGTPAEEREMYGNALATAALCELYARSRFPVLKRIVRRQVWFLERHQVPYAGWRYRPGQRESDTSVTGWAVVALLSAREAGHPVNPATWYGVESWLDLMTEPGTQRVGYNRRGRGSLAMTATGVAVRLLRGQKRGSAPVKGGLEILLANLPLWPGPDEEPPAGNPPDLYYWFFGTLALTEAGGSHKTVWDRALREALLPRQERHGQARGSWEPPGRWCTIGGRVMSTALGALALELSYRR